MVLPDLEVLIDQYKNSASISRAETFVRGTLMGVEHRDRGVAGWLASVLGNSRHLWLWDYGGLAQELGVAGFKDIRRARFGDAQQPEFAAVEAEDRWENALGIEARL